MEITTKGIKTSFYIINYSKYYDLYPRASYSTVLMDASTTLYYLPHGNSLISVGGLIKARYQPFSKGNTTGTPISKLYHRMPWTIPSAIFPNQRQAYCRKRHYTYWYHHGEPVVAKNT